MPHGISRTYSQQIQARPLDLSSSLQASQIQTDRFQNDD